MMMVMCVIHKVGFKTKSIIYESEGFACDNEYGIMEE